MWWCHRYVHNALAARRNSPPRPLCMYAMTGWFNARHDKWSIATIGEFETPVQGAIHRNFSKVMHFFFERKSGSLTKGKAITQHQSKKNKKRTQG